MSRAGSHRIRHDSILGGATIFLVTICWGTISMTLIGESPLLATTRFSGSYFKFIVLRGWATAARMRRLIDDLLNYSRVTTQAHPFRRTALGKVVAEVVSDLDELIS